MSDLARNRKCSVPEIHTNILPFPTMLWDYSSRKFHGTSLVKQYIGTALHPPELFTDKSFAIHVGVKGWCFYHSVCKSRVWQLREDWLAGWLPTTWGTLPSGVSFHITENVSLSRMGLRLHNSSQSSLGSIGITWKRKGEHLGEILTFSRDLSVARLLWPVGKKRGSTMHKRRKRIKTSGAHSLGLRHSSGMHHPWESYINGKQQASMEWVSNPKPLKGEEFGHCWGHQHSYQPCQSMRPEGAVSLPPMNHSQCSPLRYGLSTLEHPASSVMQTLHSAAFKVIMFAPFSTSFPLSFWH